MDQTETTNLWIIIGAYVVPSIIALVGLYWQSRKDKISIDQVGATIKKTGVDAKKTEAEARHIVSSTEVDSGKLSLEWAREFRERLEKVEADNEIMDEEVSALRRDKLALELKVSTLETKIFGLEGENMILKGRVKELETENASLKLEMKTLTNGGKENGIHRNP